jgi:hypothetical protein
MTQSNGEHASHATIRERDFKARKMANTPIVAMTSTANVNQKIGQLGQSRHVVWSSFIRDG